MVSTVKKTSLYSLMALAGLLVVNISAARAGALVPIDTYEPFIVLDPWPTGRSDTSNGSGFVSASFSAKQNDTISFSYTFITDEYYIDQAGNPVKEVNDWWGVALFDTVTVDLQVGGDVFGSTFNPLQNDWARVSGPLGDEFVAQTSVSTYTYTIPHTGTFQLGIGVFNYEDAQVASALLVDDIKLNGTLLPGGDFSDNSYFMLDGGWNGVFGVIDDASFDNVSLNVPGTGNYAYISSYHDPSPVPVPAAVWLLGSGLVGLLGVRRKKKN